VRRFSRRVDFVSQCLHSAGQVILTEIGIVKDDRHLFRRKIDLYIFDSIHGFQFAHDDIHAGFAVHILDAEFDVLHGSFPPGFNGTVVNEASLTFQLQAVLFPRTRTDMPRHCEVLS